MLPGGVSVLEKDLRYVFSEELEIENGQSSLAPVSMRIALNP
jgi:hypothetical protein